MQNVGATIVLTKEKWHKFGRKVKALARPLIILVPFGPVDFVYDISDTDGPDIPDSLKNPFLTKGEFDSAIMNLTIKNIITDQIHVTYDSMHKSAAGTATNRSNDKYIITLNSSFELNEKYSTLIHELAHVYCGHLGEIKDSWWDGRLHLDHDSCEIEAESVAYLVCSMFGLKTASDAYLADYIKNN